MASAPGAGDPHIISSSRNPSRRSSLAAVIGVKYKTSGGGAAAGLRRRSSNNMVVPIAVSQNDILDSHRYSSDDEDDNSSNQDQEDVYVSDEEQLFARNRDLESTSTNHQYTVQEREILGQFEAVDYLPPHSQAYKKWLSGQPSRLDWDRWIMMGLIGFLTGLIGFLLHQFIGIITQYKWFIARQLVEHGPAKLIQMIYIDNMKLKLNSSSVANLSENMAATSDLRNIFFAWIWVICYGLVFCIMSTSSVVLLRPAASGSGIPELIGYLNGTVVRQIFNIRTLIVKFFSNVCAVGSGLPVGPEGPMIHMGSCVGAGICTKFPFFTRFRNPEDKRNFITAGAAAGVSAAFGAPVGGLLFAMEEVSSFWNLKLSWQTFFCCMVSTFTVDLFNSAFDGFSYRGDFGLFKPEKYILFQINKAIAVNILLFIPTVLLGLIGGLLGAGFNLLHLKIIRLRRKFIFRQQSEWAKKFLRMVEPCIILIITCTVAVFLPLFFSCTKLTCYQNLEDDGGTPSIMNTSPNLCHRRIPEVVKDREKDAIWPCSKVRDVIHKESEFVVHTNNTINEVGVLLYGTGEHAIGHLFSRDTHMDFSYLSLISVLVIYFFLAAWAAGSHISCGTVVPMLVIGGLFGRIVGRGLVDIIGIDHILGNRYWMWIDPGAFALIGAASFFGGVARLTMSLTVIMLEITNDVMFLLPIMVSIMVAKWVGDYFTHPLYHALLELRCIPFLNAEPTVYNNKGIVNLELFTASDVMSAPVYVVRVFESVGYLSRLLMTTGHGGFPVVGMDGRTFRGTITKNEIMVLIRTPDLYEDRKKVSYATLSRNPNVSYNKLKRNRSEKASTITQLYRTSSCSNKYINLLPYINQSAPCVQESFSLHRAYIIVRSLGLRHLVVVDHNNHVKGIITRKDLMGFSLEERLFEKYHPATTTATTAATPENAAAAGHRTNSKTDPPPGGGGGGGGTASVTGTTTTTGKNTKDPESARGLKEQSKPLASKGVITVRTSTDIEEEPRLSTISSQPSSLNSPLGTPDMVIDGGGNKVQEHIAMETLKPKPTATTAKTNQSLPTKANKTKEQRSKKPDLLMCNGMNGSNPRPSVNSKQVEEHVDGKEDQPTVHKADSASKSIHIENTTCESAVL
ncbi:chloride channel protein C-like isoform X2 [Symsagittifera roscoffensis]|uniref:chloride channel protein C-like isoform X2 n=1 Tax=Symsagittifera roscoffensis TaxID=84072 RepID=UPI00307B9992